MGAPEPSPGGAAATHQIRVLRALSSLDWNIPGTGHPQLLWQPVPRSHHPPSSCKHLIPISPVLVQNPSPWLSAPFRHWKAAVRPPRTLLLSGLHSPGSPSLAAQDRGSRPAHIPTASSSPAPQAHPAGAGHSWTQLCAWSLTGQSRGRAAPPAAFSLRSLSLTGPLLCLKKPHQITPPQI